MQDLVAPALGTLALMAVGGYLLGSIPFGVVITRAAGAGDVRNIGSGNIGATNVLRTGRKDLALATLLLDGFESAAQVLCGEALGAGARSRFNAAVRAALVWGGLTGLAVSCLYALGGAWLAAAFSTDPQVIAATRDYAVWLALLPLLGVVSFVLDGVFVGAGWTRAMLGTMAAAMALYLALLAGLRPLGNHGLWAAFAVLFAARAVGQALVLPRLSRRSFSAS